MVNELCVSSFFFFVCNGMCGMEEERKRNTRLMMALCCCVLCSFSFILAFTSFVPHSRYIEMNEKRTKGTGNNTAAVTLGWWCVHSSLHFFHSSFHFSSCKKPKDEGERFNYIPRCVC
mmetsp:Transcript_14976/g.35363  ORF Transcript_14976/g.35363 Transcript_14976/m.35363 type:complete len:118 (+) Transcript_14976:61-414(+)